MAGVSLGRRVREVFDHRSAFVRGVGLRKWGRQIYFCAEGVFCGWRVRGGAVPDLTG
jgi:hypothetical protein